MDFKQRVESYLAEGFEIRSILEKLVNWLNEWESSLELESYFWDLGYGEDCIKFNLWDEHIVADFKYVDRWDDWDSESSFKLPVSWVDMFVSGDFESLEAAATAHLAELRDRETTKELSALVMGAGALGYKLVKI